ncbi:hypothetical protein EVAR_62700_1 [Eumeta japonica]|uniref:Uncharacterized protein n=1 Tax=Eumeta variegata TaxID=151549 RepID=A0A4C1ZJP4_EUMVA|nr:hypothetical protein EVAR_62700_1 [Eumeta japonica]
MPQYNLFILNGGSRISSPLRWLLVQETAHDRCRRRDGNVQHLRLNVPTEARRKWLLFSLSLETHYTIVPKRPKHAQDAQSQSTPSFGSGQRSLQLRYKTT